MRAEINGLLHGQGQKRPDMLGKDYQSVVAPAMLFCTEFVRIPTALISEVAEHFKRCVLCKTVYIQFPGLQDNVTAIVLLVDAHSYNKGIACYLHNGVNDTAVAEDALLLILGCLKSIITGG